MSIDSYFVHVGEFHAKFDLPVYPRVAPKQLSYDLVKFRGGFMLEELAEFFDANGIRRLAAHLRDAMAMLRANRFEASMGADHDLAQAGDALVDLTYVALGTAHFMGLPFDDMWGEVQRANMSKERATGANDPRSKRGHFSDVVKPVGWKGPDHEPLIRAAAERHR